MHQVTVERRVAASPGRVWEVLTDLEGSPDVIEAIDSVDIHTDPPFGVGTRWTETRTIFKRQATETMEVTAIDPGRSYVVEAVGTGATYRSEFRVEQAGDGAVVIMTFGAEPLGFTGKLLEHTVGRLFAGATRKAVEADLDDIARAAERGA